MPRFGRPRARSALIALSAGVCCVVAVSGCAVLPTALSALSTTISVADWMRTKTRAGLPPERAAPPSPGAEPSGPPSPQSYQAAVEDAYRQGVRDAVRQLTEGLGHDPRWTWVTPLVQEVWIPAQVVNGVFIPGHREWVMIRPGHWQTQFGLPLGPEPSIQSTGTPPRPR